MKKALLLTLFLLFLITACSTEDKEKNKFMDTYMSILIARETFIDSVQANNAVQMVLKKNGYTEKTFFQVWKQYTANPKEFNNMMDTIRTRAQKELIKLNHKQNRE